MTSTLHFSRQGTTHRLVATQWVPRPVSEVFEFFSHERNLERLTPSFLGFRVLGMSTPTIGEGTLIRYRLRVRGMPIGWTTRIDDWKAGESFTDVQLKGPYALWHHRHEFIEKDGGTLMRDDVNFRLPLGWLGNCLLGRWVSGDVRKIFEFRQKVIQRLYDAQPA